LEADPALFAITGDVDASLMLFVEHIGDTLLDRFRNFRLVERPASFVVNEQRSEFFAAREATNMRYQNAINTLLHETLRSANSSRPAKGRSSWTNSTRQPITNPKCSIRRLPNIAGAGPNRHGHHGQKSAKPRSGRSQAKSAKPIVHPNTRAKSKQAAGAGSAAPPRGATIAAMMQATGWRAHSVRGFLAGVVRKKLVLTLRQDGGRAHLSRDPRRRGRQAAGRLAQAPSPALS
jgi:hypothetical protein